jgi:hypothetical protein
LRFTHPCRPSSPIITFKSGRTVTTLNEKRTLMSTALQTIVTSLDHCGHTYLNTRLNAFIPSLSLLSLAQPANIWPTHDSTLPTIGQAICKSPKNNPLLTFSAVEGCYMGFWRRKMRIKKGDAGTLYLLNVTPPPCCEAPFSSILAKPPICARNIIILQKPTIVVKSSNPPTPYF